MAGSSAGIQVAVAGVMRCDPGDKNTDKNITIRSSRAGVECRQSAEAKSEMSVLWRTSMKRLITAVTLTLSLIVIDSTSALAQSTGTYQVNITNLVPAQIFTPVLVATHNASATLFTLGMPASAELQALAEMGNVMPLTARLNADTNVLDVQNSGGLHGPGNTSGVVVTGSDTFNRVSLAAMPDPNQRRVRRPQHDTAGRRGGQGPLRVCLRRGHRSERRALCVDSRTKLPRM